MWTRMRLPGLEGRYWPWLGGRSFDREAAGWARPEASGISSSSRHSRGGTRLLELDTGICLCFQLEGKCHNPAPSPPRQHPCPGSALRGTRQPGTEGLQAASYPQEPPILRPLFLIPRRQITGREAGERSDLVSKAGLE